MRGQCCKACMMYWEAIERKEEDKRWGWGLRGKTGARALKPTLQRTGGPPWWEATLFWGTGEITHVCGGKNRRALGALCIAGRSWGGTAPGKKGGCRSLVTGPRRQRQGMGGRTRQARAGWLAGLTRVRVR